MDDAEQVLLNIHPGFVVQDRAVAESIFFISSKKVSFLFRTIGNRPRLFVNPSPFFYFFDDVVFACRIKYSQKVM